MFTQLAYCFVCPMFYTCEGGGCMIVSTAVFVPMYHRGVAVRSVLLT